MSKIAIFNEYYHEQTNDDVKKIYPDGMHNTIKEFLERDGHEVVTCTLEDHVQVLTPDFLKTVDVLIWWGHCHHHDVNDEVVEHIKYAVNCGMGFLPLHSAHHSKPFRAIMGTTCNLCWSDNVRERIWVIDPSHPITQGIDRYFELAEEEMYGEPFNIPEPCETILIGWYASGEVFRSGVTYKRGNGKIFYFQPGHETVPTFHDKNVQTIIKNAVKWLTPTYRNEITCPYVKPVELIK